MLDSKRLHHFLATDPIFTRLLQKSTAAEQARGKLNRYFARIDQRLLDQSDASDSFAIEQQRQCIATMRMFISRRSEQASQFKLVHALWMLAGERTDEITDTCTDAFIEDITHVLQGCLGRGGFYKASDPPEFLHLQGRKAARVRSKELDKLANAADQLLARYADGLDAKVQKKRRANRKRILKELGGKKKDWNDYRWHLRHVIRDNQTLSRLIELNPEEQKGIEAAKKKRLPFGITPYYVSLMDYESHRINDHALRAQVLPPLSYVKAIGSKREKTDFECDFMQEHNTSPIDLITRRYPKIAIIKPYNSCSQICVYCQRNWEIDDVMDKNALANKKTVLQAIDWIKTDSAISEVLVTGGDPLVMCDQRLEFILARLAELPQIERIRIGSRIPVVLPQRITPKLIRTIAQFHQPGQREVALVTHFEHPYEITPESMEAVQKFRRAGISVYNQTVYTIENSRRFELCALRRLLRLIGVDPYYSFNTKGKQETAHFRVPIARLQQEMREEARLFPGLVRTDEAVYNVPRLGKNYLRADINHTLLSVLPDGKRVYEFFPWERFIARTETFVDCDVPILAFLQEIERRGEKMEDYHTIWYYF